MIKSGTSKKRHPELIAAAFERGRTGDTTLRQQRQTQARSALMHQIGRTSIRLNGRRHVGTNSTRTTAANKQPVTHIHIHIHTYKIRHAHGHTHTDTHTDTRTRTHTHGHGARTAAHTLYLGPVRHILGNFNHDRLPYTRDSHRHTNIHRHGHTGTHKQTYTHITITQTHIYSNR